MGIRTSKPSVQFAEIFLVTRRFCQRNQYEPVLVCAISFNVYRTYYPYRKNEIKTVPRRTARLRHAITGSILNLANNHRIENIHRRYNAVDTDGVADHLRDIRFETFNDLAIHCPHVIDEMIRRDPRALTKSMKVLWELYKRKIYTAKKIEKRINRSRAAFDRLQNRMFERLLNVYVEQYDMQCVN